MKPILYSIIALSLLLTVACGQTPKGAGEMASTSDIAIYFSTSSRDGRGSPVNNDDRVLRLVPVK